MVYGPLSVPLPHALQILGLGLAGFAALQGYARLWPSVRLEMIDIPKDNKPVL